MSKFYKESKLVFGEKPKRQDFINIEGRKFGLLNVLGYFSKGVWYCKCDCGNVVRCYGGSLRAGTTASCGCLKSKNTKTKKLIKGAKFIEKKPILRKKPIYYIWASMLTRCLNPKAKCFKNYGGRGITVCERWLKFENFLADMGEKPDGLSLDRIENDKGYYKENCRWATFEEQANNRRNNVMIKIGSDVKSIAQWAKTLKMNPRDVKNIFKDQIL